jgi:proteasome accessory factor C
MTEATVRPFVLLARAVAILADHPDGVRLTELAARLGSTEDAIINEIAAYHPAGVTADELGGGYYAPVIEFVAGSPGDMAAAAALDDGPLVRLRDVRPSSGVGVRSLTFGQLASVVVQGLALLAEDPDDEELKVALEMLAGSVLDGAAPTGTSWSDVVARHVRHAGAERRRVRIRYALAWKPGVIERVIEPYRVIRTRHGWEIDATVVGRDGAVVTFAASGIVSLDVLADRFRRPPDVDQRIERHRRPVPVELVVPYDARWAVEMHAESVEVLGGDEQMLRIRALMPPPVGPRVGLLLITAGPQASVSEPTNLKAAGRDLAGALLAHHSDG